MWHFWGGNVGVVISQFKPAGVRMWELFRASFKPGTEGMRKWSLLCGSFRRFICGSVGAGAADVGLLCGSVKPGCEDMKVVVS